MDNQKIRKTINVPLQSKKYCEPMNTMINDWEDNGDNLSTEICDRLLLLDKLYKSGTFISVLNVLELTEKMLTVYKIEDKQTLEDILSKVIKIDNGELSEIFMTLNQVTSFKSEDKKCEEIIDKRKEPENIIQKDVSLNRISDIIPISKTENIQINKENNYEEEIVNEEMDEIEDKTDNSFPMDFLLNS